MADAAGAGAGEAAQQNLYRSGTGNGSTVGRYLQ